MGGGPSTGRADGDHPTRDASSPWDAEPNGEQQALFYGMNWMSSI
jgi:hypothetical protein